MVEWSVVGAQNPWWKGLEHFNASDQHLQKIRKYGFGLKRSSISDSLLPSTIHFLKGPRSSGKTTYIKLLIKELIASKAESGTGKILPGVDGNSIFFMSAEAMSMKEIVLKIREFLDIKTGYGQYFFFLDEITSIKDVEGEKGWASNIKALFDEGLFKNSTIVLTGSDANLLERGSRVLLGRGELEKNLHMILPFTFNDFVKGVISNEAYLDGLMKKLWYPEYLKKPGHYKILPEFETKKSVCKDLLKLINQNHQNSFRETELPKFYGSFLGYLEILHNLFILYLKLGGFPRSISEGVVDEKAHESIELYSKIISDALDKLSLIDLSKDTADKILLNVSQRQGTALSFNSIAEKEGLSVETVKRYIGALENLHLVNVIHAYNPEKDSYLKKIYLCDPVLFYTTQRKLTAFPIDEIQLKILTDEMALSNIVEAIVANSLVIFSKTTLDLAPSVYFKSANGKKEIDFLVMLPDNKKIAIEVKYQNEISRSDVYFLKDADFTILVTKNTFETKKFGEKVIAVPAYLFLATLGKSGLFL